MAAETHGRAGALLSHAESLSEQELSELESESIHSEIEAETDSDVEAEAEDNPDEIAAEAYESLEAAEGTGAEGTPRFRKFMTKFLARQMIKAVLLYTRAVVKRMHRSAALRRKLLNASRRGPRAVKALVGPCVLRALPRPFRKASRRLIPLLVGLSFRFIARTAGLSAREIDVAEFESEST